MRRNLGMGDGILDLIDNIGGGTLSSIFNSLYRWV